MSLIDKFNKLNKSDFLSIFGNVFEKTEWIAEKCYDLKPYKSVDELFLKMMEIFENAKKERHLEILIAHPDLAVEKKLTKDSKNEQKNASLNQCTEQEFMEFNELNKKYKKKFSFPFILLGFSTKFSKRIHVRMRCYFINIFQVLIYPCILHKDFIVHV